MKNMVTKFYFLIFEFWVIQHGKIAVETAKFF